MVKDVLSQDEVDALLQGLSGEDAAAEEVPADSSGVRPYDLASQDRIVRGRMPTLEVINERFARLWRVGLFNFLRRSSEISVASVRLMKYSEFIRTLVVPSNLNLVQLKPLRGTALFIFDPRLIFSVVDNYFGGDGRFQARIEGRDFTPLEQRIISRMLDMVFKEYKIAWNPVLPLEIEVTRSEVNPQFVNIATPTEVVIVSTFDVEIEGGGGSLHICIPYSMIEPIRDQMTTGMTTDRNEVDHRWMQALQSEMREAEVEMRVELLQRSILVRELLQMRVGDVLPVDMPETVVARVDGIPVLAGEFGQHDDHMALKVRQRLMPEVVKERSSLALAR
ncbi:flagellar motor switching and energizing component [Thiomonas sp. X19]|uniref:flagellar motor switch protein FliM n=1 Tax=Thiomonas sp. X19 TaxID=1050370 RepID=UPI000B68A01B|nr:flagellar motor switch protein FliM [Thiomonas sp. X19]SCC91044.1 flagellar motor switching and energizing component [Thiomonas sp. X19]